MQKAVHTKYLPSIVQYRIDIPAKTGPWSIQEAPLLKFPNDKGNGKNLFLMFCGYGLKWTTSRTSQISFTQ